MVPHRPWRPMVGFPQGTWEIQIFLGIWRGSLGQGQLIWNMYSPCSSGIRSYAERGSLELIRGYKCVIRRA